MKESINSIKNVEKVYSIGLQAIYIEVYIKMMKEMVMVRWPGLMDADILDSGREVFSMAMAK